jgi:hypothetical protein
MMAVDDRPSLGDGKFAALVFAAGILFLVVCGMILAIWCVVRVFRS